MADTAVAEVPEEATADEPAPAEEAAPAVADEPTDEAAAEAAPAEDEPPVPAEAAPAAPADGSQPVWPAAGGKLGVAVRKNVEWAMADGVVLRADVYTPEAEGPFGVLLMRHPYDKEASQTENLPHPAWFCREGFIVVTQDVRGCHSSDGEFTPFANEEEDGKVTVELCAALPKANGKVGMYGYSYPGATQLAAAVARPEGLAAVAPAFCSDSYYESWTYQNGALNLAFVISWTAFLQLMAAQRAARLAGGEEAAVAAEAAARRFNASPVFDDLPLAEHAAVDAALCPFFKQWLEHGTLDEFWEKTELGSRLGQADPAVAQFLVGGWYDTFLDGTLRLYEAAVAAGSKPSLTIGPWQHLPWSAQVGEIDFGEAARNDVPDRLVSFFRQSLSSEPQEPEEAQVRLFVMGADAGSEWASSTCYPPPTMAATDLFLHSDGRANSSSGNGSLSRTAPAGEEPLDVLVSNPFMPVPSRGGSSCCFDEISPMGAADQRPIEGRSDVLCYTMHCGRSMTMIGPVEAELHIVAGSTDMMLVAHLCDVSPCGRSISILESVLRASHRGGNRAGHEPLVPGDRYAISWRLGHTAARIKAGHSLRLDIAGSSSPAFDVCANVFGSPPGAGRGDFKVITTAVEHGPTAASRITIPLIPLEVRAALDIGSGTVKVGVALVDTVQLTAQLIFEQETEVLAAQDLKRSGSDELSEALLDRAFAVVAGYRDKARELGAVELRGVCTAAYRTASNGQSFAKRVSTLDGVTVSVIKQLEEGRLGFATAAALTGGMGSPSANTTVCWDSGGASFQLSDMQGRCFEGQLGSSVVTHLMVSAIQRKDFKRTQSANPATLEDARQLFALLLSKIDAAPDWLAEHLSGGSNVLAIGGGTSMSQLAARLVGRPDGLTAEAVWDVLTSQCLGRADSDLAELSQPEMVVPKLVLMAAVLTKLGIASGAQFVSTPSGSCAGVCCTNEMFD